MLYILARLGDGVMRPSMLLVLLCVVGLLLTLRRSSRFGRVLLFAGIGGFAAFATLPIGALMMRPLENRFPTLTHMPAGIDGIVVLGGAVRVDQSRYRSMPVLNEAAGRMETALALARRYPKAKLVFTGGNADPFVTKTSEAAIARHWFDSMGLHAVTYESKSRNTYENAVLTKALVRPKPNSHWLLVTSAADMPRAIGVFREVGWSLTPYPCDYHTGRLGFIPGLPQGLMQADWAAHEWIGLVYYRLRGWTPELFPRAHS